MMVEVQYKQKIPTWMNPIFQVEEPNPGLLVNIYLYERTACPSAFLSSLVGYFRREGMTKKGAPTFF
jgi:hypothetical protein